MKIEEVFARRRFIMLDGAMGTQLQLRGLTTEQKPELAAFIMPDVLTAVHMISLTRGRGWSTAMSGLARAIFSLVRI